MKSPSLKPLSPRNRRIAKQSVRVSKDLRKTLSRVLPDAPATLLTTLCVDLADFWEIGEQHRLRVQEMKRMSGVRDRQKLARLLTELVYQDLFVHLPYHARRMKRVMPIVIEKLQQRKNLRFVRA